MQPIFKLPKKHRKHIFAKMCQETSKLVKEMMFDVARLGVTPLQVCQASPSLFSELGLQFLPLQT